MWKPFLFNHKNSPVMKCMYCEDTFKANLLPSPSKYHLENNPRFTIDPVHIPYSFSINSKSFLLFSKTARDILHLKVFEERDCHMGERQGHSKNYLMSWMLFHHLLSKQNVVSVNSVHHNCLLLTCTLPWLMKLLIFIVFFDPTLCKCKNIAVLMLFYVFNF